MKLEKMDEMDWTGIEELVGDSPQCGWIEICQSPRVYWYVVVDEVSIAVYWMDQFYEDFDQVPAWTMETLDGEKFADKLTKENMTRNLNLFFERVN